MFFVLLWCEFESSAAAEREHGFSITAPPLSAKAEGFSVLITTPSISANSAGIRFEITAPELVVATAGLRFAITSPPLIANTSGMRVAISSPALTAIAKNSEPPLASFDPAQRQCPSLYACFDKFTVRNAISEVSNHRSATGPGFCKAVRDWLGGSQCATAEFRNDLNNQFSFPYSPGLYDCGPLEAYMNTLRSRFAAGKETQSAEEELAAAFMRSQNLLLSGQSEAFCTAIMQAVASG